MEALGFNNIFGEEEINNLFDDEETESTEQPETPEETEDGADENKETKTTEVDPEDLFEEEEEKPESVGSEKNTEKKGDAATDEGSDTSPNFYSSIANALAVDGIFPNSDEEAVGKVDSAESLSELIEAEINARLDEKQQRISKALENGVEPSDIRRYEGVLAQLSKMTEQQVTDDSEKGENLRYQLIYQDFLNKGMSPEKAEKYTKRTIDAGTDVEDAKEALQSNREYFQMKYRELLDEAQKAADLDKADRKKQTDKLKESIMKDKELLGDIEVGADVRKKAFESITKPVYKDTETGEYLTAVQKYEQEHRADFLKYVSLFYALTNGFKDFDGLAKGKVKKEVRKGLSALEKTLNGTRRNSDGSLRMVTSVREDPESYSGKTFRLDL